MKYPLLRDMTPDAMQRLLASYRVAESGCWEWQRSRTTGGYGHFHFGRHYYQAHRLIYVLLVGPIADELTIDHLCRNRRCVNPAHLEPVTPAVNTRRGIRTRLTPLDIEAIRADMDAGYSLRQIARGRGLSHSTISRIRSGHIWKETAA